MVKKLRFDSFIIVYFLNVTQAQLSVLIDQNSSVEQCLYKYQTTLESAEMMHRQSYDSHLSKSVDMNSIIASNDKWLAISTESIDHHSLLSANEAKRDERSTMGDISISEGYAGR